MLEKKMEESYEEMLFMYGISCAENLVNLGKITQDDYDKLMDYNQKKEVPPRDFVERVFATAVERIGDEKTPEAVERYFRERHNEIIDKREGSYDLMPDSLCELCKYSEGVIVAIDNNGFLPFPVYRVTGKTGNDFAFGMYFNGFKVGDKIAIHNKSAVRKIA
jgi:hypothetical protein